MSAFNFSVRFVMRAARAVVFAVAGIVFFLSGNSARAVPFIQVTPGPISFGDVELSTTSQLSVTITATAAPGELVLFITGFSPLSSPFSANLSCGDSCTGSVSFTPSQVGPANATLSFEVVYFSVDAPTPPCDDGDCPAGGVLSAFGQVQLSGNGVLAETPLPATLPLFATGLGALGLVTYRRRKQRR